MTVTVIGHLCIDEVPLSGKNAGGKTDGKTGAQTAEAYGGIYYSVAALSALLGPDDSVRPVFGVGKEDHAALLENLAAMPNVDPSGVYKLPGPTNRVSLRYPPGGERIEVSRDIADPIPWRKIQPALDTDLVLVNMISGNDVALETLDEIRMRTRDRNVPVHFDLHSLTLGSRDDFSRFRRPVEAWRRWLFMLHSVQMNETEAAAMTPEGYGEEDLAKQALALNTRALCITRGSRGCTVFVNEKKHIVRHDVPGLPVEGEPDATGCGDVFGAAWCARILSGGDPREAAEFANEVAAARAALGGSAELGALSRFRAEAAR